MDTTYLIKRRQTWYVNVRVPPIIEPIIGKQNLQRSLKTRDLSIANRRKLSVVSEFKNYIESVRKALEAGTPITELMHSARLLAQEVKLGHSSKDNNDAVWSELLDRYLDRNHERNPETGEYLTDDIATDQIRIASSLMANPDIRLLSSTLEDYLSDVSKHIRQQTEMV